MANVTVFTDIQIDKQTGQTIYAPGLLMQGHKNEGSKFLPEDETMEHWNFLSNPSP